MFECHKESSLLNKQDFIISLVYLEGSISKGCCATAFFFCRRPADGIFI